MLRAVILFAVMLCSGQLAAHQTDNYETVADELANALVSQLQQRNDGYSQLGLTRWVMADSLALPYQHDNIADLSHQLSEALYAHLQQRNVRLIDYRAQQFVSISDRGATLLSRDVDELNTQPLLDWVLVGTMAPQPQGVAVNLRVIDRESQNVLAAANHFVPKHVYARNRSSEIVGGKLQRND